MRAFIYFINLILFVSTGSCFLNSIGDTPSAYLLPKGQLETNLKLYQVNSTVDVFKFRHNVSNADDVGNMKGYGIGFRFGLVDNLTIIYDRNMRDYSFGRGVLDVKSETISLRRNLRRNAAAPRQLAFQLSHRTNRGEGINKLFSSVTVRGTTYKFLPASTLEFGGSKDSETAFMLIASQKLHEKLIGSAFVEYAPGRIKSELQTNLPIQEITDLLEIMSYSQKKWDIGYGLHYKLTDSSILEMDYHYIKIDRSKDVTDPVDENEIYNARYIKDLNNRSSWSLHGRYMRNQFIGDHSFLYNKRVADRSKKRYGYMGLSYTFRYGYGQ